MTSFLFLFFDNVLGTVVDYVYGGVLQPFNMLALIVSLIICWLLITCYQRVTAKRELVVAAPLAKTIRRADNVAVRSEAKKPAFDLPSDNAVLLQRSVPAVAMSANSAPATPTLSVQNTQVLIPTTAHIDEAVALSITVIGSDNKPFLGVTPNVEILDETNITVPHKVYILCVVKFTLFFWIFPRCF